MTPSCPQQRRSLSQVDVVVDSEPPSALRATAVKGGRKNGSGSGGGKCMEIVLEAGLVECSSLSPMPHMTTTRGSTPPPSGSRGATPPPAGSRGATPPPDGGRAPTPPGGGVPTPSTLGGPVQPATPSTGGIATSPQGSEPVMEHEMPYMHPPAGGQQAGVAQAYMPRITPDGSSPRSVDLASQRV